MGSLKTKAEGTPLIRRTFKGVGTITKRARTNDRKLVQRINHMLDSLYQTGQLKYLRGIKEGRVTFQEVLDRFQEQTLNTATVVEDIRSLKIVFDEWLERTENLSPKTVQTYKEFAATLFKLAGDSQTISDLPTLLKTYRDKCRKRQVGAQFNAVRNTMRTFVSGTLGRSTPLYSEISNIKPIPHQKKRVDRALTVKEVWELTEKMDENVATMVWTLCMTGMGWTEYQEYEVLDDRILIHGHKMKRLDDRRNREVPLFDVDELTMPLPAPPNRSEKILRKHLVKASPDGKKVTPYDFRNTYAYWMAEAAIPEIRRRQYMGHLPTSMTEMYSRTELGVHLAEDAKRMAKWLAEEIRKAQKQ